MAALEILQLLPEYHERVWGGTRLQAADPPIGEAWIVYEQNRIAHGPDAGATLADVAAARGAELLGTEVVRRTGTRFPLLIKLLDTADWLSLQVHPNDAQAVELEGAGQMGKTEAWHILEAAPDAELIAGLNPGLTRDDLAASLQNGTVLDLVQYHRVRAGDSVFIPAGTIHALGPGLLLYEVQQTSDITYRVFDWNRPLTAGRALHIDQTLAVADLAATGETLPAPELAGDGVAPLVACPYFDLRLVASSAEAIALDTRGASFHAVTVLEGTAQIEGVSATTVLRRFETAIVPAAWGAYRIRPIGSFRALTSSVI